MLKIMEYYHEQKVLICQILIALQKIIPYNILETERLSLKRNRRENGKKSSFF